MEDDDEVNPALAAGAEEEGEGGDEDDSNGFVWVAYGEELSESNVLDAASPCDMVHAGSVTLAGRRAIKLAHRPGH